MKSQAQHEKEQCQQEQKARRTVQLNTPRKKVASVEEIKAALTTAREHEKLHPVKTNDENMADYQLRLAQLAMADLNATTDPNDMAYHAKRAFGFARSSWNLLNPQPMMKAVHRHWLKSIGQNVDHDGKLNQLAQNNA